MRADPAQQGKALRVVGPLAAVDGLVRVARTPVQQRRVDHVGRHQAVRHLAQAQRDARGAEARADLADDLLVQHRAGDRRQAGQQQARVGAPTDQRLRQCTQHVGQTTGLDQGKHLGPDMQDPHAWFSLSSISRVTSVMPFSDR